MISMSALSFEKERTEEELEDLELMGEFVRALHNLLATQHVQVTGQQTHADNCRQSQRLAAPLKPRP